jgi:hypothetical protein
MKNKEINNLLSLNQRIAELRFQKYIQEEELKVQLKDFVKTLNPLVMAKESIRELARDKEVQFDLTKVGLNMGANFLIEKVIGRNKSVKGFLSSILIEKVSTAFINNNAPKIISGIAKIFNKNTQQAINN